MALSVTQDYLVWDNREAVTHVSAGNPGGTLRSGLLGYYRLDEAAGASATDTSGNLRTLTQSGAPGSAAGRLNTARSFDDAVLPTGQSFNRPSGLVTGPTELTVALWLWLDSVAAGYYVFQQWSTVAPFLRHQLTVELPGVKPTYLVNGATFIQGTALTVGTWTHLACVGDAAGIRLYQNGALVASNAAVPTFASPDVFYLGANGGLGLLDGRLDEVAVYAKALTAAEVRRLYNRGRGLDPTAVDPTTAIADARRTPVTRREMAASGGVYVASDRVWLLPDVQVIYEPKPADRITDSDGVVWTVLEAKPVGLGSSISHHRLVCRNLVVAAELYDLIDVERPTITYDASGVALRAWTTAYSAVGARVQSQEAVAVEERGLYGFRGTHLIYCGQQLTLTAEDRVKLGTTYYEVRGWRNAQRIDELFTIDAELVP